VVGGPSVAEGGLALGNPRPARREKRLCERVHRLKHCAACATVRAESAGSDAAYLPLLRTSAVYAQRWSEAHPEKRAAYSRARRVKHEPRPCYAVRRAVCAGPIGGGAVQPLVPVAAVAPAEEGGVTACAWLTGLP
jgi:hypothetical protein